MNFKIEQIALCLNPNDEERAWDLLHLIGITDWVKDQVVAEGRVFESVGTNAAELNFNYTALQNARELEVLRYEMGDNWLRYRTNPRVSHLGMHCTADELAMWKELLFSFGLTIAQEVRTTSHTNPEIAGKRWYHYCIFSTANLIGVDLKFIVRRDAL